MTANDQKKRAHMTERIIHAPCRQVFNAFVDPELLAQWWGPAGFSNSFKQFEFFPAGSWIFTMHGPDGQDYHNECRFVEITENRKIVIKHFSGHHFVLTLDYTPLTNDATRVGWCQLFDTVEHYQQIAEFVSVANEQNLDRLEAIVKQQQPFN